MGSSFGAFETGSAIADPLAGKGVAQIAVFATKFTLPLAVTALGFLFFARVFLLRRAFSAPRRWGARAFAWMDAAFNRVNRRFGNIALGTDKSLLLEESPILWRESTHGVLGQPQHLARIAFVFLIAAFFIPWTVAASDLVKRNAYVDWGLHRGLMEAFTIFTCLLLIARGVGGFGSERTRQTLDVMLCTPMARSRIVLEKMRPVRWLAVTLGCVLVGVRLANQWIRDGCFDVEPERFNLDAMVFHDWGYNRFQFFTGFLGLFVLLWQVCWFAAWCGLRFLSHGRALVIALCGLAMWILIPYAAEWMLFQFTGDSYAALFVRLLSPTGVLVFCEHGTLSAFSRERAATEVIAITATALLFHAATAAVLKMLCLCRAEKYLHRA